MPADPLRHLGHNRIAVLEGLETLTQLRELHLEAQQLPDGDALVLDPRSLRAVAVPESPWLRRTEPRSNRCRC